MEKDFEMEIYSEEKSDKQLLGDCEGDGVCVYMDNRVYTLLEEYARSNTDKELGAMLLGSYLKKNGKINVLVDSFIEAKFTEASAARLTFTHKTWQWVHEERERKYPTKKIVGWQHTHPGYGVFLSKYDMFIHENFFDLPFQIAYVIDPVHKKRGFFGWQNGQVEPLKGFYMCKAKKSPAEKEN